MTGHSKNDKPDTSSRIQQYRWQKMQKECKIENQQKVTNNHLG